MSLGRTKIMWRCARSHFISVATPNNCSDVVNQTLLRPLYIQLAFLDLALCFLNLLLIHMIIEILLKQAYHRLLVN
jgi:hypothetical protein